MSKREIYLSWDEAELTLNAEVFVASYMFVNDAEIARHELADGLYTDDEPFQYKDEDADEIYEDIFGESVPLGLAAFLREGDLFLGASVAVASQEEADRVEAYGEFVKSLAEVKFKAVWLHQEWTPA